MVPRLGICAFQGLYSGPTRGRSIVSLETDPDDLDPSDTWWIPLIVDWIRQESEVLDLNLTSIKTPKIWFGS